MKNLLNLFQMTVLFSQTPHVQGLINHLRTLHKDRRFSNIKVICNDGVTNCPGLVLASVSPIMTLIGQSLREDEDPIIILPDIQLKQFETFLHCLMSEEGPDDTKETAIFLDLLHIFSNNYSLVQEIEHIQSVDKNEEKVEDDHFSDWKDCDSDGESDSVEIKPKKRMKQSKPKKKAKLNPRQIESDKEKLREMVKNCYFKDRNAYICQICCVEKSGPRSMQVTIILPNFKSTI